MAESYTRTRQRYLVIASSISRMVDAAETPCRPTVYVSARRSHKAYSLVRIGTEYLTCIHWIYLMSGSKEYVDQCLHWRWHPAADRFNPPLPEISI